MDESEEDSSGEPATKAATKVSEKKVAESDDDSSGEPATKSATKVSAKKAAESDDDSSGEPATKSEEGVSGRELATKYDTKDAAKHLPYTVYVLSHKHTITSQHKIQLSHLTLSDTITHLHTL